MIQASSQLSLWTIISQAATWRLAPSAAETEADLQQMARQSLRHLPEYLLRDMGL